MKTLILSSVSAALLAGSALTASGGDMFEIKQVTCVEVSSVEAEGSICQVLDLTKSSADPAYGEVTLFVGLRLKADAIVLGGGAKIGLVVTVKVPFVNGEPDAEAVKKSFPELKNHPAIKQRYGQVKSVILDGVEILNASPKMKQEVKKAIKKSHLHGGRPSAGGLHDPAF